MMGQQKRTGHEAIQSMTSGSPIRLITEFMLPLLLGNLF